MSSRTRRVHLSRLLLMSSVFPNKIPAAMRWRRKPGRAVGIIGTTAGLVRHSFGRKGNIYPQIISCTASHDNAILDDNCFGE